MIPNVLTPMCGSWQTVGRHSPSPCPSLSQRPVRVLFCVTAELPGTVRPRVMHQLPLNSAPRSPVLSPKASPAPELSEGGSAEGPRDGGGADLVLRAGQRKLMPCLYLSDHQSRAQLSCCLPGHYPSQCGHRPCQPFPPSVPHPQHPCQPAPPQQCSPGRAQRAHLQCCG